MLVFPATVDLLIIAFQHTNVHRQGSNHDRKKRHDGMHFVVVCGRSLAGIVGLNPAGGMAVHCHVEVTASD